VNPEALEEAKERFEERLEHVIVLRVLTKEEVQKLAQRTAEIRGNNYRRFFAPLNSWERDLHRSSDDWEVVYNTRRNSGYHFRLPRINRRHSNPTDDEATKIRSRVYRKPSRPKKRRAYTVAATETIVNVLRNSLIELSRPTDERYQEERRERRAMRHERNKDRRDRDEYDDDSENEFKPKAPRMLEAPAPPSSTITGGTASSDADFVRNSRERMRDGGEREREYSMSGGLGHRRDDGY
jgi:zinc finger CCCH domain-containing protein 13